MALSIYSHLLQEKKTFSKDGLATVDLPVRIECYSGSILLLCSFSKKKIVFVFFGLSDLRFSATQVVPRMDSISWSDLI